MRAHVLAKGYADRRDRLHAALRCFGKSRLRCGGQKYKADKNPDEKGVFSPVAGVAHLVVHWIDELDSKSVPRICAAQAWAVGPGGRRRFGMGNCRVERCQIGVVLNNAGRTSATR